jgi:hypothetical protein
VFLRRLLGAFLLTLFCLAAPPVAADGITVKSAELQQTEDAWEMDADLDVNFNPTLEEALTKGITLYFVAEFELVRPRSYWFGETVASLQQQYRLRYNALTRQYQLSTGIIHKNLDSLDEVRHSLGLIRGWKVAERAALKKGQNYRAGLALRLDTSRLPKPLQLSAMGSKEWNLDSGWYYWTEKQ